MAGGPVYGRQRPASRLVPIFHHAFLGGQQCLALPHGSDPRFSGGAGRGNREEAENLKVGGQAGEFRRIRQTFWGGWTAALGGLRGLPGGRTAVGGDFRTRFGNLSQGAQYATNSVGEPL